MPKFRIFTWVILVINLLFLIWVISAIASASGDATDCGTLSQADCNAANDTGVGIAVFLIIVFWAFVDVILGVLWLVTRSRRRDCPACGQKMPKKSPTCESCGFDYRRLMAPGQQQPPTPAT
jgi:hypothetical protein